MKFDYEKEYGYETGLSYEDDRPVWGETLRSIVKRIKANADIPRDNKKISKDKYDIYMELIRINERLNKIDKKLN